MEYRLFVVRIFVTDWERALAFYSNALGMRITYRNDELGWAQLDTGATSLALERMDPDDREAATLVGRFVGASLQVPDVEALYRTLRERGVIFSTPPEKQTWGGTLAHFLDPDGNILTLIGSPE
jgi:catechol 2,3-dioxygenase-like lactoylglutathione lyase family enzyme